MAAKIARRVAAILRFARLPFWVGVYWVISSPFLASLIIFLGIFGFILASWSTYFVWSVVFYRLLSNQDAVERARRNLSDKKNTGWFWRIARFVQARAGVLAIYFFFLTLGPVFSVPMVKVSGRGDLKGDWPILLVGSLLAAPPLLLMALGLATFTPIPHWILELLKRFWS